MVLLKNRKYRTAVEEFNEIERIYPFSKWAVKSQVMTAYANYRDGEYDDTILTIERFIRLNPANSDIAYMYYLKALSYYNQIVTVDRDQEMTVLALAALKDVTRRFPGTEYAVDTKIKMDLVKDHLAGKEMQVGRFYLNRAKYIAAANRFNNVVIAHQTTSHVPEALYRLVEAYLSMGVAEEAHKNAAILGYNYPDSKWYKYAYRLVEEGKNSPTPEKKDAWYKKMMKLNKGEEEKGEDMTSEKDKEKKSWLDIFRDAG